MRYMYLIGGIIVVLIGACTPMKHGFTRQEYNTLIQEQLDAREYWVGMEVYSPDGDNHNYRYWNFRVDGDTLVSSMWFDVPEYGKIPATFYHS
ncbi:hypothetical protein [Butyricimonas synergistica]|uniref:hypothetical protein n=1 Tax=Butyricimonas synergistica TaxID=544644 RepID=UPI0003819B2D|nr:hypothetical protein [Butyricimonas synergistica]